MFDASLSKESNMLVALIFIEKIPYQMRRIKNILK